MVFVDGKIIRIQIVRNKKYNNKKQWDTAGHEKFRAITTSYYRGAHAIIIVFDLTEQKSFLHVTEWLKHIEKYAKENVLKFLVGNKTDLVDKRVINKEEANKFAEEHNLPYIETSAKDGVNIEELFDKSLDKFLIGINFKNEEKNIKLEEINKGQTGCC